MRLRPHRQRAALHLIAAGALAAQMVLTVAVPALANHCTGGGTIRDRGADVVAECHGVTPGRLGRSNQRAMWNHWCSWVGVFEEGDRVEFTRYLPLTESEVELLGYDPTGEYWWYTVLCWRDGVGFEGGDIAVEERPPVPPEVLRDRAAARIAPPAPSPATSPPLSRMTFVQMATWLWLDEADWEPLTESETQGFTTVTVSATPVEAVWDMGDGDPVTCVGPGVAWTPGAPVDATDCSHTYAHSSYGLPDGRFEASVAVTWVFEWSINDQPQGVFGDVELSTPFAVAVAEIQAVETGG